MQTEIVVVVSVNPVAVQGHKLGSHLIHVSNPLNKLGRGQGVSVNLISDNNLGGPVTNGEKMGENVCVGHRGEQVRVQECADILTHALIPHNI